MSQATEQNNTTAFDPAAWTAEAKRRGYKLYVYYSPDKLRFSMGFEFPHGKQSDDLDLWRWLRPNKQQMEANHDALREYLVSLAGWRQ